MNDAEGSAIPPNLQSLADFLTRKNVDLISPENPSQPTNDTQAFSTVSCSNSLLAKMWEDRAKLVHERFGFAQYFYTTLCSHLESELTLHLEQRISDCGMFVTNAAVLVKRSDTPKGREENKAMVDSVRLSLASILDKVSNKLERASLFDLVQLYGQVFGRNFDDLVGGEVAQDIRALGNIRNLFAHGRDFFFQFRGATPSGQAPANIALESHSLEVAAGRLRRAGILPDVPFDRSNHEQVRDAFYADAALLHFYQTVRQCEETLRKNSSPIALVFALAQALPDLS